jgi:hypothetical protein
LRIARAAEAMRAGVPLDNTARLPTGPAERQRRARERRRDGRICVVTEVSENLIESLRVEGRLAAAHTDDRDAIAAALENLHRDFANAVTRDREWGKSDATISIIGKTEHESSASLLRKLAKLMASADPPKVWAELESYRMNRWRTDRYTARCPYAAETVEATCWHILKRNPQPPPHVSTVEEALKWKS